MKGFLGALTLACCLGSTAHALAVDKAFYGLWDLNVGKSKFGLGPAPKAGMVSWNRNGYAFSIVLSDGTVYADGISTQGGCRPIGLPDEWSCELEAIAPNHLRLTMKRDGKVRRVGDIEILPNGTTRTTHHVFPVKGAPYVETTVWQKEPE